MDLKFEWMWKDEVQAVVDYNYMKGTISVKNIGTDLIKLPFGIKENITLKDLDNLMEERSVPRSRNNIRDVLKKIGMTGHSPLTIVRKANGIMQEDFHWVRFSGEKHLTFRDVRGKLLGMPRRGDLTYNNLQLIEISGGEQAYLNQASKGNQTKWRTGEDLWVKGNMMGYEGLAETVSSELLKHSNINELEFEQAIYGTCYIEVNGDYSLGCLGYNFLEQGEELITVEKLFRLATGEPIDKVLRGLDIEAVVEQIVDTVKKATGLSNFGEWLTFVLEFDKFIFKRR